MFERRLFVIFSVMLAGLAYGPSAGAQSASQGAGVNSGGSATQAAPSVVGTPSPTHDYVLGSGDVVRIIVFGEETLSGQFGVAGDGNLSFPLIGDVRAAGKTVEAVRNEIAAALRDGYLVDPKVSAEVSTFRPYYILGEVNKPGQYPYIDGINVMNAVATAGGFTYRANHNYVLIKRSDEVSEHKVRLNDQLGLSPGETVHVIERYF